MTIPRMFAMALASHALISPAIAIAQPRCKPELAVSNPQFSGAMNLRRFWTATVNVDASACATSSGLFALGFVRSAEMAPDLNFTEPFVWRSGQTSVRVEFWADEAVERYWIADVPPCPCRDK